MKDILQINNHLLMFAANVLRNFLFFSFYALMDLLYKVKLFFYKVKMEEDVQLDRPWANDADFYQTGEKINLKILNNWLAFHTKPICISFSSLTFFFFFKAMSDASEDLKDSAVTLGLSAKSLSPPVSFLQFQTEVGFLSPATGVRSETID